MYENVFLFFADYVPIIHVKAVVCCQDYRAMFPGLSCDTVQTQSAQLLKI